MDAQHDVFCLWPSWSVWNQRSASTRAYLYPSWAYSRFIPMHTDSDIQICMHWDELVFIRWIPCCTVLSKVTGPGSHIWFADLPHLCRCRSERFITAVFYIPYPPCFCTWILCMPYISRLTGDGECCWGYAVAHSILLCERLPIKYRTPFASLKQLILEFIWFKYLHRRLHSVALWLKLGSVWSDLGQKIKFFHTFRWPQQP